MAAMTSFRAEKCRRLASRHEASVLARLCNSARQFLVYSAFIRTCFEQLYPFLHLLQSKHKMKIRHR